MKRIINTLLSIPFLMLIDINDGLAQTELALETKAVAFTISVEIPRIETDAYFRPYVAVWLETEQREAVQTLALWYQVDAANTQEDGSKWLKDLRQWWRKVGKKNASNYDGFTGATRRPGQHKLVWKTELAGELEVGNYFINFEAAREEGGRTFHRAPFAVKKTSSKQSITIPAEHEFGEITIYLEII